MTMDRDIPLNLVVLCATLLLAVAAGGCAQNETAAVPTVSSAAPVESGGAHGIPLSVREDVAAGRVPTTTVEKAISSLPGLKLPAGPLAPSPDFALVNDAGPGRGVVEVVVYYASDVMIIAYPEPNDLGALEAEVSKATETNPFVDGKRHDEMLSTPLGPVLAIQGGWQQRAPRMMPSRVIFNIDGIGYTIDSTSADPIPVEQLVALAQTMR